MKHPVTMSGRRLPPYEGVRPQWPGEQVGRLFVRRGPSGLTAGRRPAAVPSGMLAEPVRVTHTGGQHR